MAYKTEPYERFLLWTSSMSLFFSLYFLQLFLIVPEHESHWRGSKVEKILAVERVFIFAVVVESLCQKLFVQWDIGCSFITTLEGLFFLYFSTYIVPYIVVGRLCRVNVLFGSIGLVFVYQTLGMEQQLQQLFLFSSHLRPKTSIRFQSTQKFQ